MKSDTARIPGRTERRIFYDFVDDSMSELVNLKSLKDPLKSYQNWFMVNYKLSEVKMKNKQSYSRFKNQKFLFVKSSTYAAGFGLCLDNKCVY